MDSEVELADILGLEKRVLAWIGGKMGCTVIQRDPNWVGESKVLHPPLLMELFLFEDALDLLFELFRKYSEVEVWFDEGLGILPQLSLVLCGFPIIFKRRFLFFFKLYLFQFSLLLPHFLKKRSSVSIASGLSDGSNFAFVRHKFEFLLLYIYIQALHRLVSTRRLP